MLLSFLLFNFQEFRLFSKLRKGLIFRLTSITAYSKHYHTKFLLDRVCGQLQTETPFAEFEVTGKPCSYPNRECSTDGEPSQLWN